MDALDEENEILLSIYPDEYERVKSNEFVITQKLDSEESGVAVPPIVTLTVTCLEGYPETIPKMAIRAEADRSGPAQEEGALACTLDEKDVADLHEELVQMASESVGMAMIFTLASGLRERASALLLAKRDRLQHEADRVKIQEMEKEEEKFRGTPVTRASFLAWKAKFDVERAEIERRERHEKMERLLANASNAAQRRALTERRLTGRELFEQGQAREADEDNDDDEEGAPPAPEAGVASLRIDA